MARWGIAENTPKGRRNGSPKKSEEENSPHKKSVESFSEPAPGEGENSPHKKNVASFSEAGSGEEKKTASERK